MERGRLHSGDTHQFGVKYLTFSASHSLALLDNLVGTLLLLF